MVLRQVGKKCLILILVFFGLALQLFGQLSSQNKTKHSKTPKTKLNNLNPVPLSFVYLVLQRMSQWTLGLTALMVFEKGKTLKELWIYNKPLGSQSLGNAVPNRKRHPLGSAAWWLRFPGQFVWAQIFLCVLLCNLRRVTSHLWSSVSADKK